ALIPREHYRDLLSIDVNADVQNALEEHVYSYPPFLAWLTTPFTLMSSHIVQVTLWYLLIMGALIASIAMTLSMARSGENPMPWPLAAAAIVISFGALLGVISNQQSDSLILLWAIAGAFALTRGKSVFAAMLFGAAAAAKGPLMLLIPWLAWRRRFGVATLTLIFALGWNLVPDLTFPLNNGSFYLERWLHDVVSPTFGGNSVVATTEGIWGRFNEQNQSLGGMIARLFSGGRSDATLPGIVTLSADGVRLLTLALYGSIMGAVLWMTRRKSPAMPWCSYSGEREEGAVLRELAIILLLSLLFSPMTSPAHLCMIFPGVVVLMQDSWKTRNSALIVTLGFAALFMSIVHKDLIGRSSVEFLRFYGVQTWQCLLLLAGLLWSCMISRKEHMHKDFTPESPA
ncbi:MAG: DUF2029 domain-containing protein, partial [Planctomycetes bacterium]|nr:DUF2029 domain-containing protein [Planctomycetota bacterium]